MPEINGWVFERCDAVVCLDDVLYSFGDEVVERVDVLLHEASDLWNSIKQARVSKQTDRHGRGVNQMGSRAQKGKTGTRQLEIQASVCSAE